MVIILLLLHSPNSNAVMNIQATVRIIRRKKIAEHPCFSFLLIVAAAILSLSTNKNNNRFENRSGSSSSTFFVRAFQVPRLSSPTSTSAWNVNQKRQRLLWEKENQHQHQYQQRFAPAFAVGRSDSKNDDSDDGASGGAGMEDAFRELGKLKSLDDANTPPLKPKEKDETFAKVMEELDLKDILSTDDVQKEVTMESQVELYKDMVSELDAASDKEELIVADFKTDLLLADDDIDDNNNNNIDNGGADNAASAAQLKKLDTQKFMDKAIEEALKEAKERNSDVETTIGDKESFLDNKEIMKEIENIFDKANEELLNSLDEIRAEQTSLARLDAERNAKVSQEKIDEDEQRLELANSNMKKMLSRVNEESTNVENAIEELKRVQEESDRGLDSQLVDLKRGGLIKQATLVGGVLFTFRSGAEIIGFLAGDPSHAVPALIQGALAVLCIFSFIFL